MSDPTDPLLQAYLVEERSWEAAGGQGVDLELQQLKRRAAWTLLQKIEWLEEMQKLQRLLKQSAVGPAGSSNGRENAV